MIFEENSMCGVHLVIYLYMFLFVCSNFIQYGQHYLVLLTGSREKVTKFLYMTIIY